MLVIVLLSPALLAWPVLSDRKRRDLRDLVQKLVDWAGMASGAHELPAADAGRPTGDWLGQPPRSATQDDSGKLMIVGSWPNIVDKY